MIESVFRIINRRITIDTIWSCHLSHFKQVFTKNNRVRITVVFFLSIQRVISGRCFAVHLPFISVFHYSFHCCMVRFLASSKFTISPFTFLLFRLLVYRLLGITPLITSTAKLDTVLYANATLSAAVRCADDKIIILQSIFNGSAQISLP